jgi:hypothetical protein
MTKDLEKKYQNWKKERRYQLLNYEKIQHLELLNQQDNGFNSKLQTYSIILIDHLNWEIRDQYLELLDKFIDKKIDSFNFRIAFCERYESIEKVADLLQSNRVLLSPDKNSFDFGQLLSEIDNYCKAYSDDPEPFRNKFEIGEVEFRISIEKIYLKIQNFLKEE